MYLFVEFVLKWTQSIPKAKAPINPVTAKAAFHSNTFPTEVGGGLELGLADDLTVPVSCVPETGGVVTFVEVVRLVAGLVVTVELVYGFGRVLTGPPGLGTTVIGVVGIAKVETMVWETEWLPVSWEYPGVKLSMMIGVGRLEMERPVVGRGDG